MQSPITASSASSQAFNSLEEVIAQSARAKTQTLATIHLADKKMGVKPARPDLTEVPRPRVPKDRAGALAHFVDRATSLSATVAIIHHMDEVPHAVLDYLRALAIHPTSGYRLEADGKHHLVINPECQHMGWQANESLIVRFGAAEPHDRIGVTSAFCAIADTGTLMLLSGKDRPSQVSLLPETHICVLESHRLVSHMEEAWALLATTQNAAHEPLMPRAVNFVSGPSRTGDIEQTLVLGAHGPMRVHLVVIAPA